MRWLFVKDLEILRRSPLLVALLIIYPVVIALMIGFALSSPPGKPKVALYDAVPTGRGHVNIGNQQVDIAHYANQLFQSITPIRVSSRSEAIAKVRALMDEYGLTPADLSSKRGPKPSAGKGGKVAAKYRDTATGNTWSGRGLQPNWLKAALASGRKLGDFAV